MALKKVNLSDITVLIRARRRELGLTQKQLGEKLGIDPQTRMANASEDMLNQIRTEIEKSEATLDYLPPHGERQGGLIFQADPAGHELRLEAEGYVDP